MRRNGNLLRKRPRPADGRPRGDGSSRLAKRHGGGRALGHPKDPNAPPKELGPSGNGISGGTRISK